jgi:hypothetical protein
VSERLRALPAWTLAAAFAIAYVLVAPLSSDLAAAGYRSELFSRAGFTLWDNGWYGGHHVLAYSVLAPALGSLLGTQPLGALAAVLATALFGALVGGLFAPRATRVATLWFALGASITLLANRIPFELGVALGVGALLAARDAQRGASPGHAQRRAALVAAALLLAVLSALASPIAGAFVALATLAWTLSESLAGRGTAATDSSTASGTAALDAPAHGTPRGLALPAALTLAALAPVVLLSVAFPEGGAQPFVPSAFWPALAAVIGLGLVVPREQRLLRVGALLYALALIAAYAIPTAVGGNADRLGALFAGPLLACALIDRHGPGGAHGAGARSHDTRAAPRERTPARGWRTWALLAFALALLYWQVKAPIADTISAAGDPAAKRSYYAPLLGELRRLDIGYGAHAARVEVVPTREHAEARWIAGAAIIARGWERQLDTERNALFYAGAAPLTPARYRAWLDEDAVSYVALADAPLDYAGRAEGRIVGAAPSYLREVWRSAHWRLFAVRAPVALAQPPAELAALDSDSFTLRVPRAGTYQVRVRFTPYWALADGRGCVSRAPGTGEWTDVHSDARGRVRVAIDFSLTRVFEHGARCG